MNNCVLNCFSRIFCENSIIVYQLHKTLNWMVSIRDQTLQTGGMKLPQVGKSFSGGTMFDFSPTFNMRCIPIYICHSRWQWNSQKPGFVAMNLNVTKPPLGTGTVSLRTGLCVAFRKGVSPDSYCSCVPISMTANVLPCIWNGWLVRPGPKRYLF